MRLRRARSAAVVALVAGLLAAGAPSVAYARTAAAPPATLETAVGPNPVRAGAASAVVGHLLTADLDPLPNEPVELYTRTSDTAEWTYVSSVTTDAHGAAAFQVRPQSTTTYLLRHPATATADATSRGATVNVGPSPTPPKPPERVVADAGDAAVRVAWLPPADDGGAAVTSYRVTATSGAGTREVTVDGAQRAATLTGLANDAGYTVSVTATTSQGSASQARAGYVTPRAGARLPAAGTGTPLCGRLPFGVTRLTAAASPYLVCPLGLVVPLGATLVVEGADVRFRASSGGYPEPYGLDVLGGGLQVADSTLRGETGRRGEWRGVLLHGDTSGAPRAPATLSLTRGTVRDVVSGVSTSAQVTLLRVTDSVLANASQHGLYAFGRVRATGLTVRDVAWYGVWVRCWAGFWLDTGMPCPVALDGVTVERAGERGLTVDTPGPVSVKNVLVTGSGTAVPVSEAARFETMSASFGPGGDVEDVRGGGNGIDAVVLDATATNDVVWRTPAVTPLAAPAPLGYVLRRLVMAPGRTVTFPAGSVVKSIKGGYDCRTGIYENVGSARSYPCHGSVEAPDATIDASAPGTVFTGAADDTVGIPLCPSRIQPTCGGTGPWWNGLAIRGSGARATLAGATVRGAAVGLHANVLGAEGLAVSVTGTAFQRSEQAVVAFANSLADPLGSATVTDVTVTDTPVGIQLTSLASVDVARTTVRRSGGVSIGASDGGVPCARRSAVSVTDLLVEDAPGSGLRLANLCHPLVRRVTVRRSGLLGADARIGVPAVVVTGGTTTLGPAGDVDGVTGGGNGVDAIGLGGVVEGPLEWRSPYNASADHPLGYVVGHTLDRPPGLTVSGAHAVTVPAGGLVASYGAPLTLEGGTLDASAGGARFVSVLDPLASELGCRSSCGTSPWVGVVVRGPGLRLTGATVRGGAVDFLGGAYDAAGAVAIADSSFEDAVLRRPKSVSVTGSRLTTLDVVEAEDIDVSRNAVAAGGSISLEGSGDYAGGPVYLRDNAAAAGRDRPAYYLANAKATFGPGGTVHGNTGAGANAVLRLSGVTTDADLTWLTPTQDPRPHPVGYAVGRLDSQPYRDWLVVRGPRTLRVPAGAIVKGSWIRLEGARLDATAGGATFTGIGDDTVGLSTCGPVYGCDASDAQRYSQLVLESVGQTLGSAPGAVGIERARVLARVSVEGPATDAPGAPGYGLSVRNSYVQGGIRASGADVSVTGTRFRTGGIRLDGGRSVVRDVLSEDAEEPSLDLRYGHADVSRTVVRRSVTDWGFAYPASVRISGYSSGGTFSCLDVRDNVRGVAVADAAITISDSALAGNAGPATEPYRNVRYDLDNYTNATTTGVWWGQAGGPLPGQVRDPAKHTDLAPRGAAPACAVADATTPPGPARDVTAAAGVRSVHVTWREPAHDGGSPVTAYRVTLAPGTTVVVGPGERGATFTGLTPGEEHFATVTPVNAVAAGPESKAAVARPTAEEPSPTPSASASATVSPTPTSSATPSPTSSPTSSPTASPTASPTGTPTASPSPTAPAERAVTGLSAAAPRLVTYGTAAVVSGRLTTAGAGLPDRDVTVHVRRVGSAYWGAPVATVRTSPTGAVAYALRLAANSEVYLGYAGDAATLPTSSVVRVVQVRPVVSAAFSKTSITYGYSTGLYGRVSPSLAGRPVRLERHTSTGWQPVARAYLTQTSNYRFGVKPGARGTFYYRVVYAATATHARAVSPTRALTVR